MTAYGLFIFNLLQIKLFILCIATLVVVSMFFTRTLTKHIMQPLNELERGVKRIKDNDLTVSIDYQGDQEFEEICDTFNDMQQHILSEQEKNRKYEQATGLICDLNFML